MFEYKAEVVRVIDGDTLVVKIDLGFHTFVEQTLRLYGINAPETRGSGLTPDQRRRGTEAKEHLTALLRGCGPLTVRTLKDRTGKYGRYLAVLYGRDEFGAVDLNQKMVRDGHASESA